MAKLFRPWLHQAQAFEPAEPAPFRPRRLNATPAAQGRTISPIGVGSAPTYNRAAFAAPALYNPNVAPGSTNPPIVFEPPAALTAVTAEVWIIATGGPSWGGCNVYISNDNSSYALAGAIHKGGRQGYLTAPLAAAADPDLSDTLAVDLSESAGQLLSGTQADADTFVTLCFCDGELVSYETATLTAANKYNLTYLRRGVYGTTIAAHSAGTKFARIGPTDPSLLKFDYPPSFIGGVIYIKLPAFNIFGGEAENLADVLVYAYSLTGHGLIGTYAPNPQPVVPAAPPLRRLLPAIEAEESDHWRPPRRFVPPPHAAPFPPLRQRVPGIGADDVEPEVWRRGRRVA